MNLANKKVTVIGAKRSGVAVARLVARMQGRPRISDCGPAEIIRRELDGLLGTLNVDMELGRHSPQFIAESDLLVLSPGVRFDAQPVQWARERRIPVLGEIEFAWQFCRKPVIAVTGSNGKTTTATLIHQVLEKGGCSSCLCGNVGSAFSQHVLDLERTDFVVLELSSFQLESIVNFRPHIAVFLNFSQNHLDRHKDMQEYWDAKKRLFINQTMNDFAVLNDQAPRMKALAKELKAKIHFFNSLQQIEASGIHNPNFLAALEVADILAIKRERCHQAFQEFKGVEHRLEFVRTIQGVDFINDSKSTTTEATRWALQRSYRPLILICGGRDKNLDFSILAPLVRQKVKKLLAIGEAQDQLKNVFQKIVDTQVCGSLPEAVKRARDLAREGDCVLLSPMCASFDMFDNYEQRGRVFKELVMKL